MSIKSQIKEIVAIKEEVKRYNLKLKELRTRAKELEGDIITYMKSKSEECIKCDGTIISISDKNARQRRGEKGKKEKGIEILSSYKGKDPEEMISILMENLKGSPYKKETLKFKKITEKV